MRQLRRLAIVLAVTAYALVFGEVFLRLFAPQPLVPRYVTGSPDGVRANMPNVRFRQWTPEVDVTVAYNDAGLRDDRPAPPLAKPAGQCRVALLGDSYFVGFESDWADSFPNRLEQALRAAGANVRVLDFAVSGLGTAENLVILNSRVARWRPDVVIESWHASDPADNIRSGLFRLGPAGLERAAPGYLPGVEASDWLMQWRGYRWLIENSHLYSAVRERAGMFTKALLAQIRGRAAVDDADSFVVVPPPAPDVTLVPQRAPGQGESTLDRALVAATRDAATAIGAHFLLFDVPIWHSRTDFVSARDTMLGAVAGVETVSPQWAFQTAASADRKLYWEEGHLHWTPAGNAIAADVAAQALIERGWLAACLPPGPVRSPAAR